MYNREGALELKSYMWQWLFSTQKSNLNVEINNVHHCKNYNKSVDVKGALLRQRDNGDFIS